MHAEHLLACARIPNVSTEGECGHLDAVTQKDGLTRVGVDGCGEEGSQLKHPEEHGDRRDSNHDNVDQPPLTTTKSSNGKDGSLLVFNGVVSQQSVQSIVEACRSRPTRTIHDYI